MLYKGNSFVQTSLTTWQCSNYLAVLMCLFYVFLGTSQTGMKHRLDRDERHWDCCLVAPGS